MEKNLFGFVCLFFFLSSLTAEAGLLDDLKNKISPKEKKESMEKIPENREEKYPRRGDGSFEEKLRLQEQEYKLLAAEFENVVIKPFGPLEWEDSLWSVVEKINKIEGVEQIEFKGIPQQGERVNLKGITKKDFLDKLDQYTDEVILGLRGPKTKLKNKGYEERLKYYLTAARGDLNKYLDIQGNEKIAEKIVNITISPIIIKGVPFVMTIAFFPVKGMAIAKPEDVLPSANKKIMFPVVINEVNLSSNSPMLKDNYKEIITIFEEKYGKFKNKQFLGKKYADPVQWRSNNQFLSCVVKDQKGYRLDVNGSPSGFTIKYTTSDNYIKSLDEIYRKHLADLEAKKVGGKKDMSQGL